MAEQRQARELQFGSEEELKKTQESEKTRKFLSLALSRFKAAADHETPMRKDALEDWKFSVGEQWPDDIRTNRNADGRPCLTMDHLNQSVRLVTNEERQRRPAIECNPQGSGATRDVAEVLQGMIRHVEVRSDCEMVYDTGFDHMARGGFGYLRLLQEYLEGDTFDQDLRISPVMNPFSVYVDPIAVLPDQSDARYKFIIEDVPTEEYKHQHPESKAATATLTDFTSIGTGYSEWHSKETIRVAEYFVIEVEEREIIRLRDGRVVDLSAASEDEKKDETLKRRKVEKKKVKWYKINALEILEERELPGPYIPLIPVLGDDLIVDGKRYRRGLVRNAKDPQRAYNYQVSAATEMVALAPKAPWVGAKGQFSGDAEKWKSANVRNWPYLEYDPVTTAGTPAPPPQRNVAEPPIQATVLLIRQADMDLKASLGLYDASFGQQGPEQSGKAILARQKQGDLATLNFSDNFDRSLRHLGRVILSYIPVVYDTPRIQRIFNPDGSIKHVGVYSSKAMGSDYSPQDAEKQIASVDLKAAIKEIHDIGVGNYDVALSVGPNNQTKRMEAMASMMALVQSYPPLMQVAGDLLVGNMDWPFASEISKRLRRSLPPNVLDPDDDSPDTTIAKLSGQLQQMSEQHQALTQLVQKQSELLTTKRMETESRERIAAMNAEAGLIEADLKAKQQGAQTLLENQLGALTKRLELLHEHMTIDKETEAAIQVANAAPPAQGQGQ